MDCKLRQGAKKPEKELAFCPYSARHVIPIDELETHKATCPSKQRHLRIQSNSLSLFIFYIRMIQWNLRPNPSIHRLYFVQQPYNLIALNSLVPYSPVYPHFSPYPSSIIIGSIRSSVSASSIYTTRYVVIPYPTCYWHRNSTVPPTTTPDIYDHTHHTYDFAAGILTSDKSPEFRPVIKPSPSPTSFEAYTRSNGTTDPCSFYDSGRGESISSTPTSTSSSSAPNFSLLVVYYFYLRFFEFLLFIRLIGVVFSYLFFKETHQNPISKNSL